MKISTIDKSNFKKNLVFLIDKKSKLNEIIPKQFHSILSKFKNDKKEFDYFKFEDQTVFFIKSNSDLEKNRINGFNIRQKLGKEEDNLVFVSEENKELYTLLEGFLLSNYQFLKYFKDADEKKYKLDEIEILGKFKKTQLEELNATITAVSWARDMVNEPVSFLTATQLAKEIEILAKTSSLKVEILEKTKIEALKMGGLLAVNKGSIEAPTFTIIEYKPQKFKNKKPIVLVGKGVVYDTGGLSLKPTAGSMDLMKSDNWTNSRNR
jgi:leucyl aminopeptidase